MSCAGIVGTCGWLCRSYKIQWGLRALVCASPFTARVLRGFAVPVTPSVGYMKCIGLSSVLFPPLGKRIFLFLPSGNPIMDPSQFAVAVGSQDVPTRHAPEGDRQDQQPTQAADTGGSSQAAGKMEAPSSQAKPASSSCNAREKRFPAPMNHKAFIQHSLDRRGGYETRSCSILLQSEVGPTSNVPKGPQGNLAVRSSDRLTIDYSSYFPNIQPQSL